MVIWIRPKYAEGIAVPLQSSIEESELLKGPVFFRLAGLQSSIEESELLKGPVFFRLAGLQSSIEESELGKGKHPLSLRLCYNRP